MNRILIGILGVIVVGVSLYYISISNDSDEVASLNELESEQMENLKVVTIEGSDEVEVAQGVTSLLENQSYDLNIAYQEGQEVAVKAIIGKQHEYLNELAGWGNAEQVDVTILNEDNQWNDLEADIKWLKEHGLAASNVIYDMLNASQFYAIATNTGDSMSIRYLHRIFHDLDALVNRQKVDKVWDVTHAFGTEKQQQELFTYLSKNATRN